MFFASLTSIVAASAGLLFLRRAFRPAAQPPTDSPPWKAPHDPALASDVGALKLTLLICAWTLICEFGRLIARLLFQPPSLCFYDVATHPGVDGLVALTIDDAFCRRLEEHSLIEPLRKLLAAKGAKATFFCTLKYSEGAWREAQIAALLREGHELANHCEDDRPYSDDSPEEFERGEGEAHEASERSRVSSHEACAHSSL